MTLYGVIVTHNSFASEADIVIGDVYLLFWPWGSYKLCWKKSNYQIHLNLIIFQTLGWYLYIMRAIYWYSKQPVFLNNLLKKVSLFLNSLHASPTRWVIKILLPLLKVYHAIYWDCSPLPAMFPFLYQFQFSSSDHILHQLAGFCQCGFLGSKLTVALIWFLHVSWNVWLCWKQNRTLSSFSFPNPGISVPWTHCMLMSSSIQAVYWKYISTLLLYFSFSSVATRPFSLKIRGGFTFCSPSALVQSWRVACCLSKPGDGCSTLTGLAPNVL